MNVMRTLVLLAVMALVGCGSDFEGTYSDEYGMATYEFKPGGVVRISGFGATGEVEFEKEGNEIKIPNNEGGTMILTLQDDGSIDAGISTLLKVHYLDGKFIHELSGTKVVFSDNGSIKLFEDGENMDMEAEHVVRGTRIKISKEGERDIIWNLIDEDTIRMDEDPDSILKRD